MTLALPRAVLRADALLARLAAGANLLTRFTPENAATERARLVACLRRGHAEAPRWTYAGRFDGSGSKREIRIARDDLGVDPLSRTYRRRLAKLRLQIDLLEAVGDPARVLTASRRVYGVVDDVARSVADAWLAHPVHPERRDLPPVGPRGTPSVAATLRAEMLEYGLLCPFRVEPRLAASAAVAPGEVILGGTRGYSLEEAQRLAAHEIGVHLVAQQNAADQPLAIFAIGTAGATRDQEGLALWAEVARGVFTPHRRRGIAARTLAVALLADGSTFPEAARALVLRGVDAEEAVYACERAFRGGGLTKDAAYVSGFLRVGRALARGGLDVEAMSVGRVGLRDRPIVRALLDAGVLAMPRRRSRELVRLARTPIAAPLGAFH